MNNTDKNESFFDRLWNFFTSVKLSVALLLTLAVTSIIGTVIPQNQNPMLYQQRFGEVLYPIFDFLNLFDMYHSWWFRLLISLLIVNILVCSIERLSSTWKIIFPKKPNYRANRFRKSPNQTQWIAGQSPEAVKDIYGGYMARRFRHSHVETTDGGYLIFGEKGRWTRLGVYVVHLSILLLMLGGLIGSIFGYEGYMNVPVGASDNTISLRNSDQAKQLDFTIRCDDFTVSHYPSGMPKEYRSEIAIIDGGKTVLEKALRVNDPIHYAGIRIFQSSYGKIPGDEFTVVFTENASGLRVEKRASIGDQIALPADGGTLVIEDFTDNFGFRGHNIGPTFLSRLVPKSGTPQPLILPLQYPSFDKMRQGDYTISIENIDYRYYTGLQITRDPGVPLVYAGFLAMIIGCYITFFMFHQQICIELSPADGKTTVSVAGISPRNRPGIKTAVKRLARKLGQLTKHANKSV